jgi:hypothetical protein
MKRLLLTSFVFLLAGFVVATFAQQTLTLKVIQTGEDGGIPISFDDGEYENDSLDRLNDDDLDMGWEGDDLNVMTCFTRFQNVSIPQGSVINSATLTIFAHEDESAPCNVTIYAEDIDDSPMFAEQEAISDRTWTTASVRWEITDSWTMWQPYRFPDLAAVFQAVIDRPGWASGNALTLFMQGEDQGASLLDNARDLESFENIEDPGDGGDGLWHPERVPAVTIYYTAGGTSIREIGDGNQSSLISVYPNPTDNGMIHVSSGLSGPMRIEIFNVAGRLVKVQERGTNPMMIDVSDLHEGFYLIRTSQQDLTDIQKIIIR